MKTDKIKEGISEILDVGGKVSFNYKHSLEDWYGSISIYYFKGAWGIPPSYNIDNGPIHGNHKTKEKAINKFVDFMFSEENLAYVLERIADKNNIEDWEEQGSGFDFENPGQNFLDLIEEEKKIIKKECGR